MTGRIPVSRWETVVAAIAFLAAGVAFWVTVQADFLAYPGWLAVQKADLILGPVLTGLYWRRRRPGSRFALVLIAVGFLNVPYILQSSATPWAFSLGVIWEGPVYLGTLAMILAFPTGRLDGVIARLLLAAGVVGSAFIVVIVMVAPVIGADGSISGCLAACPDNGMLVSTNVALALRLDDAIRAIVFVSALTAVALIAHRFASGTPPRRRALVVGAPIAVFFLLTQAAYQGANLLGYDSGTLYTIAQWAIVVSRASLWYGFLLALVAAELFAGRVLRGIVEASLRRPSLDQLETMLKEPLGDPDLELAFLTDDQIPQAPAGRVVTTIERDGRSAVAIIHDAELAEDPELVHAAGAVALLAEENAQLEAAWNESLRDLRDSRARIAAAGHLERRALERDLHDGAQQQLTAVLLKLALVRELVPGESLLLGRLQELEQDVESTLEELRRLGHGIYPSPLADAGLAGALGAVAQRSGGAVAFEGDGVGRYRAELESAVYFCCLEALQNASKHAGAGARISIRLQATDRLLLFQVCDDGVGFDRVPAHDGVGLRNMRDRVDAFDGRLEITSARGRGTAISGALPIA